MSTTETPKLYRQKEHVYSAEQWWPPGDMRHKPIEGVVQAAQQTDEEPERWYIEIVDRHNLSTLRRFSVNPGDWILRWHTTPKYEYQRVVSAENFERNYEPAPNGAPFVQPR